ncbi:hypothetical protein EYC84_011909 [Monilinia fructicola]|uniref:Uncharacterized protein n=1 Tax=Monilinia fructicola TaxID=38448 RepID=A0A5M9J437_MONFR|nr:hypothetical protein EYC84_011909 [Monilinia fructicola]
MQVPYIKFDLFCIKTSRHRIYYNFILAHELEIQDRGSDSPIFIPSFSCELRLEPAKDQELLKQDLASAEALKEHFDTSKELEGLLHQLTVRPDLLREDLWDVGKSGGV